MNEHNQQVHDFFEKCKREDPERYAKVCDQYPTISGRQWRRIQEREESRGLLGLQPSYISVDTAEEYGLESVYENEE